MNLEHEVHAINKKLGGLITSIALLQERRENDKEDTETLSGQVKDLAVAVNRLNLTIGKKDGIQEGKSTIMKWVWSLFGALIIGWVMWVSTSIATCISNDKAIKRECNSREGGKT